MDVEDGNVSVTVTKTGAAGDEAGDEGSTTVTVATSPVSIHMQNYGQEGGDKVKEDGNGNVLSFKGEPGAERIYREYNPNSGEHFYTTDPAVVIDYKARGWTEGGVWYAGGVSDGASASSVSGDFPSSVTIQVAAGSTDITVESEENGDANLVAVMNMTGEDLSSYGNLDDVVYTNESAGNDETGED